MKINAIVKKAVVLGTLGILLMGPATFGQVEPVPIPSVGCKSVGCLVDYLRAIVRWAYIIFFILAVLIFIYVAFLYLTSGGSEEKVKKAKTMLIYALIALVVAFLASGFETIIGTFLTNPTA